jgi:hypothetical protein
MGKGFTLHNTEGRDLADMFHEAFERKVIVVFVEFSGLSAKNISFLLLLLIRA